MSFELYYFDGSDGCVRCQSHEGFYDEEIRPHPYCDCQIELVEVELADIETADGVHCETIIQVECPVEEHTYTFTETLPLDLCHADSMDDLSELRFNFENINNDGEGDEELARAAEEQCGWTPPNLNFDEEPIVSLDPGFRYEIYAEAEVYEATITGVRKEICENEDGEMVVVSEEELEYVWREVVGFHFNHSKYECDTPLDVEDDDPLVS